MVKSEELWEYLGCRKYPHHFPSKDQLDFYAPTFDSSNKKTIEDIKKGKIKLFGCEYQININNIDWSTDSVSKYTWPKGFYRTIDFTCIHDSCDVKFPWELSRLQWAIPLGQAWTVRGDIDAASRLKDLLVDWIKRNPCGWSVNWCCAMEPSIRIVTWIWFFYALKDSPPWADKAFRKQFLNSLYVHGIFVENNLEKEDISGNHYIANATALIYLGLFFGKIGRANRWERLGWKILQSEIQKQVSFCGVNFEGSLPYHRFVTEMLLYPAIYRKCLSLQVDSIYVDRLVRMANFIEVYSRPDGSFPILGDCDNGRLLPLGSELADDHRYLAFITYAMFCSKAMKIDMQTGCDEILWAIGNHKALRPKTVIDSFAQTSKGYYQDGYYVLASKSSHVMFDCGPVGFKNRGVHGHNDLLSIDVYLCGVHLISDCGMCTYTGSVYHRNLLRGTSSHNTPQVDNQEINRIPSPDDIWLLSNDAEYRVNSWSGDGNFGGRINASHNGYTRLSDPVIVNRVVTLNPSGNFLIVEDSFQSVEEHCYRIPYHLAPDVNACLTNGVIMLSVGIRNFTINWFSDDLWLVTIEPFFISKRYGSVIKSSVVVFSFRGGPSAIRVVVNCQR
jgi:hypothetical protein